MYLSDYLDIYLSTTGVVFAVCSVRLLSCDLRDVLCVCPVSPCRVGAPRSVLCAVCSVMYAVSCELN